MVIQCAQLHAYLTDIHQPDDNSTACNIMVGILR